MKKSVLVDVSVTSRQKSNSGIARVTRRLVASLQEFCFPVPCRWDSYHGCFVLLTKDELDTLGLFNGPVYSEAERRLLISPDNERTCLDAYQLGALGTPLGIIFSELSEEENFLPSRQYANANGLRSLGVFYDTIPITHPGLCSAHIRHVFSLYVLGLRCCDVIAPISGTSGRSLESYYDSLQLPQRALIKTVELPGEFGGTPRTFEAPVYPEKCVDVLCVSTLEPRKNHRMLLRAFEIASRKDPTREWTLTLLGAPYVGAEDLEKEVRAICESDRRVTWKGIVSDDELSRAYRDCTLTVYPSTIEGFGMPILESLWYGKPCVCSQESVMGELAQGGGCVPVDVFEPERIADGMLSLVAKSSEWRRFAETAVRRPLRTWRQYAGEIFDHLQHEGGSAT